MIQHIIYHFTASSRLLYLLGSLTLVLFIVQLLEHFWYFTGESAAFVIVPIAGTIVVGLVFDLFFGFPENALTISRNLAGSAAVGQWTKMSYQVINPNHHTVHYHFFDETPPEIETSMPFVRASVDQNSSKRHFVSMKSNKRGSFQLENIKISIRSKFGFWYKNENIQHESKLKVYPDFSLIKRYIVFAQHAHTGLMGIKQQRKRGQGASFHQLREHQRGDSIRQINWPATARHHKLISTEYQEEKQQQLLILLDCGRRMRSKDGPLSHFDHALNAAMLLSYVALRQGDAIGVMTMGSSDERFIPVRSGAQHINVLHNGVYDLQPGEGATDFIKAATRLEMLQKKRCLIVVITNLHEEDYNDILPAIARLQKKQLVLLANLQEGVLDETLKNPIEDMHSALTYASTQLYVKAHQNIFKQLKQRGIRTINTHPDALLEQVVSEYFSIKKSQSL